MPIINCRLAPLVHQRFHEVCEERGVTASDVLRKAVEGFIDRVDDQLVTRPAAPDAAQAGPIGQQRTMSVTIPTRIKAPSVIGYDMKGEPIYARGSDQKPDRAKKAQP